MQIESENKNISKLAVLLAVLFHLIILFAAVILEFEILHKKSTDFVDLSINIHHQNDEKSIRDKNKNPSSNNVQSTKLKSQLSESVINQQEEINNVTLPVAKSTVVIDDKYDSLLDSVLLLNPSFYGLKYAMKNNMKNSNDSATVKGHTIEVARKNLKNRLIALYKDRYGEISPDKYAGQNKQGGIGVSIPIDDIINLLSELF